MLTEQSIAPPSEALLQEYHKLLRAQIHGSITDLQRKRLARVEQELEALDEKSDAAIQMQQQMAVTAAQLDQLLCDVDTLPDA